MYVCSRVREDKRRGTFVEGLLKLSVTSYSEIQTLLQLGNKARITASTQVCTISPNTLEQYTFFKSPFVCVCHLSML
jgi:hypothetical protein